MTIAVNDYVKQNFVKDKARSHFEGTWEEFLQVVRKALDDQHILDMEHDSIAVLDERGKISLQVPPDGFFCPIVELRVGDIVQAVYKPRFEGDTARRHYVAVGIREKTPAKIVNIILYSHELLAEKCENSTDADWEIVAINADPYKEPTPPTPETLATNELNLPGGTPSHLTMHQIGERFLKAWLFWNGHAFVDLPV